MPSPEGASIVNSSRENDSGPQGWVDAFEERAIVGWFSWPGADTQKFAALMNGALLPMSVYPRARADVAGQLGITEPAHAFKMHLDVMAIELDSPLSLTLTDGEHALKLVETTAAKLLLRMVEGLWINLEPAGGPGLTLRSVCDRVQSGAPSRGFKDRSSCGSEIFVDAERPVGPRFDVLLSRYQEYVYYRHVRDHPGYRTARNFPIATRDGVIDFLIWSLRSYAAAYSRSPLPAGSSDLRYLNTVVTDSGLPKWRGSGVFTGLPLTKSQVQFARAHYGKVTPDTEEELADWLLAWLGSWGWGHRGRLLMTPEQIRFLASCPGAFHDQDTLGAVCTLNRFAEARLREQPQVAGRYADLHLPHVRHAYLWDLLEREVEYAGTPAFLPAVFWDFVEAILGADPTVDPASTPRQMKVSAAHREGSPADVRVIGMLDSKSGLGQNARQSVMALDQLRLTHDEVSISINDRTVAYSDSSVQRPPARINIWHLNPDNLPEAVTTLPPSIASQSYNIGFFAWELDVQPRAHQLAIDWVDEIWVPSNYCAESFRACTEKPVTVIPHAVILPTRSAGVNRGDFGLDTSAFVVHYSFDMHSWPQRKNPLGVIQAFQTAFTDGDARLLLKIRNGQNIGNVDSDLDHLGDAVLELAGQDHRVIVDVAERTYAATLELLKFSNCHISLHRSEGFGYTLAESLALGVPLICSDYGGARDFCTDENSWLVPVKERYLREGEYYLAPPGAVWGEPDVSSAVRQLRRIRAGGPEIAAKAQRGQAEVEDGLSLKVMASRYESRLAEILERL